MRCYVCVLRRWSPWRCTATSVSAAIPEQVRMETGLVAGVAGISSGVRVFKGMPFAAPPLGENRWRAPQPAAKWDGVFKANAFGPSCIAGGGRRGAAAAVAPPRARLAHRLRRPARRAAAPAPRCRSRHGRRLPDGERLDQRDQRQRTASGDGVDLRRRLHRRIRRPARYDGEDLAAKGAVIVTMNYRLGAFGFFAHPELAKEAGHNALRQLRDDGRDRRAAVGQAEHRARSAATRTTSPSAGESAGADHGRRARRIAAGQGPLQPRDRPERRLDGAADGADDAGGAGAGRRRQGDGSGRHQDRSPSSGRSRSPSCRRPPAAADWSSTATSFRRICRSRLPAGKQNDVDVLAGSNKDENTFFGGGGGGRGGRGGAALRAQPAPGAARSCTAQDFAAATAPRHRCR